MVRFSDSQNCRILGQSDSWIVWQSERWDYRGIAAHSSGMQRIHGPLKHFASAAILKFHWSISLQSNKLQCHLSDHHNGMLSEPLKWPTVVTGLCGPLKCFAEAATQNSTEAFHFSWISKHRLSDSRNSALSKHLKRLTLVVVLC